MPITEVDALRTYLTESPQQPYEMKPCCLFDRRKGKVTCPSPLGTGVRAKIHRVLGDHKTPPKVTGICPDLSQCLQVSLPTIRKPLGGS